MRTEKIQQVFSALNQAGVRYLVVGGIAVIAHGYQRLTVDIDLVIALTPENIRQAMRALTELGYRPKVPVKPEEFARAETRAGWIRDKGMMVFQLASEDFRWEPIDIFVNEPFPFEEVHPRAIWLELGPNLRIPVVPLADLLALKRAAAREQDLIDVRELLDYQRYQDERKKTEGS